MRKTPWEPLIIGLIAIGGLYWMGSLEILSDHKPYKMYPYQAAAAISMIVLPLPLYIIWSIFKR